MAVGSTNDAQVHQAGEEGGAEQVQRQIQDHGGEGDEQGGEQQCRNGQYR